MVQLARKVLKNVIYNSLSILISKSGGLIFTIILARLLSPELFGMYHLALAIGFLLLSFTDLGINRTLIRYVSYAISKNDVILARSYFRYLLKLKFVLASFSSLSLILLANPLALHVFHEPSLYPSLIIVGIFLFFQSFLDFVESVFISLQKFEFTTIRHITYETSRLFLVPLLILLGYYVYGALGGLTISVVLSLLVLIHFLLRKYNFLIKGKIIKVERKRILRFLSYLTVGTVSGIIFAYVDSIMLGIFMPVKYVGFYRAAYNIVFAFIGLVSIAGVLFPVFTGLEGKELETVFKRVFKYSAMLSFPCAVGLAYMAEPFIEIIYGPDYKLSVLPLYILSLLIVISPLDFFIILFNAKERPEYPAKLVIISSILNIVLNYLLIIKIGMIGAAIATVISRYFNVTCLGLLSKKIFGILPEIDTIYKPMFSSLIISLFLYFIPTPKIPYVSKLIFMLIIYICIMFLIKGIEKEDIRYLSAILGPKRYM